MIVYGPENILSERIAEAEKILSQISQKHCFITGSFLYKESYKDIDIFVITRTKKKITLSMKKVKVTVIDFNELYSLFYHSITKSCISKSILPKKSLKVTFSDYWQVINEAIPTLLNQKNKFRKEVRSLVLYTEYLKTGEVLDTFKLDQKICEFKDYKQILQYVTEEVPGIARDNIKASYLRRFFYTQAGYYRNTTEYRAQSFLYQLTHEVTREAAHG